MAPLLVAVGLAGPTLAEDIAQQLRDFREELGDVGAAVATDADEFEQAVRRHAEQRARPQADDRLGPRPAWPRRSRRGTDSRRYGGGFAEPKADAEGHERALRDTAYELDRLAHRLETRELFAEADALRATATRLRLAARGERKPDATLSRPSSSREADREVTPAVWPEVGVHGGPRPLVGRGVPLPPAR